MEDVIELLREHAESIPVPLELPNDDDLLDIQEQLLLHIPYDFREFLLLVSDVVLGHLEPVTASDPHCHTYLPEVTATAWELGLPRHCLPLCQEGDNYYAVDPEGQVLFWSYATQEFDEDLSWESVWHWARDCWLASVG